MSAFSLIIIFFLLLICKYKDSLFSNFFSVKFQLAKKMTCEKFVNEKILFACLVFYGSFTFCYKINERNPRIASGQVAVSGENLDYVLLTVVFQNQMQTCGGVLVHPRYVLTTASCVYE